MAKNNDEALQRASKALAHPLRVRILEEMGESETSPNGLSQVLGESLGNVSYHVKALVGFGAISLTKTEPRRGAVEHFYKRTGTILPKADANVALDAIAKVVNGKVASGPEATIRARINEVREILRETGRKV